jgi:hypothetical protein
MRRDSRAMFCLDANPIFAKRYSYVVTRHGLAHIKQVSRWWHVKSSLFRVQWHINLFSKPMHDLFNLPKINGQWPPKRQLPEPIHAHIFSIVIPSSVSQLAGATMFVRTCRAPAMAFEPRLSPFRCRSEGAHRVPSAAPSLGWLRAGRALLRLFLLTLGW